VLIALGFLSTAIYYAPFFIKDWLRAGRIGHTAGSQSVGAP
jgi:hypothetical protein